jgi:quercetin dioxygenase-like cupin family protein
LILALSREWHHATNVVAHELDDGTSLHWELLDDAPPDALLSAEVDLDPEVEWLLRLDRVDFPPGGVAHRHTHPGPGIRCLLFGSIRIESGDEVHEYGPFDPWFESGSEPVFAAASETEPSAFVRAMLLPEEWRGKRTIRYVDPADEEKPKLQRPTVFFDRLVVL